jgi:predicted O-linked N-acetylglucosamine transferase (SPINDLY family)
VIGKLFGRAAPPKDQPPRLPRDEGDEAAERAEIDQLVARGMAHVAARRHELASDAFDRILVRDPDHLVALYQRANVALAQGDHGAARAACDAALRRHPGQADLELLSGAIAAAAHDPALAIDAFERARAANPDIAGVDERLGEQLAFLGRGAEAIAAYDRAVARQPDNVPLGSNRLFLLNHFGVFDREKTFEEHRNWGTRLEAMTAAARRPHWNDRTPERRLRVGFVSPDLRNHPIAYWLEGYLVGHDRERFPAHAFDVSPFAEDAVSARLRTGFDHWYKCSTMSDDELAGLVRGQRIDVLVDLAGHTGHNRLGVFARKPAPVQVSWFGYMQTTGLATIDWRFTDAQHDPPGAERYYSEKLWRLPSVACFMPDPRSPDPGSPPVETRGHVTFASVNNWAKVTDGTKDAWASILRIASQARLKVVALGGNEPRVRDAIVGEFTRRGVHADRVDVAPFMPLAQFLDFFRDVDVALDPFPYGGGTTTLHTLWMGVPIVALEGDTELARATPSALRALGLTDFIASTVAEYVAIGARIAADPTRLSAIRSGMRAVFLRNGAADYAGFARSVEDAFRGMWRAYCDASPVAPPNPFDRPASG